MKIKLSLVSSVLALTLLAPSVLAAGGNGNTADGKKATNTMDIEFMENTDPTKPVDPEKPDEKVDPKDPDEETGNKGPLSIDLVSNYRFGQVKITGNDNTFNALPTQIAPAGTTEFEDRANYVQVTDNRGTGAGWKLSVEQPKPLTHTSNSEITGTKLSLLNGVSNSVYKDTTNTPTTATSVVIEPGAASIPVVTAGADQGIGTWTHAFGQDAIQGAESVQLFIPGNQKIAKGSYVTTLHWTLTDDAS